MNFQMDFQPMQKISSPSYWYFRLFFLSFHRRVIEAG